MSLQRLQTALLAISVVLLPRPSAAQGHESKRDEPSPTSQNLTHEVARFNPFSEMNSGAKLSPLRGPSGSVSQLDLRAPAAAKQEYDKGYELLMRRNFQGAIERLVKAVSIFPDFVAAHSALGSAYLELGQNDQARDQFANTVSLDDHLPNSYLNLGRAQLSLKDYPGAEESLRRGSHIAPLDPALSAALVYAQYMNQHYQAALDTAREVHSRRHPGAAIVHYYAAAASYARDDWENARAELQLFLQEDPKSPAAESAHSMLGRGAPERPVPPAQEIQEPTVPPDGSPGAIAASAPSSEKQRKVDSQTPSAESRLRADLEPAAPFAGSSSAAHGFSPRHERLGETSSRAKPTAALDEAFVLHSEVREVAVLFAATDHGKSVTDLTQGDVEVRDDQKPPLAVTGFRNESELPLRLGLVIDASESITGRFSFEQHAAIDFVQHVLTGKNDLAFVVGFANSVLLVQDSTNDQRQIARTIDQLAPAGGTALWDAVAFAAERLRQPEITPVARMLVVISDGMDNSSAATPEQAVEAAKRGDVLVYTVSTGEGAGGDGSTTAGNRALRALAEETGGTSFVPGTFSNLSHILDNLQQVIRSRYLISYTPAKFENNGRYRTIDIAAKKGERKLRVFARRGYYADTRSTKTASF